MVSRVFLIVQIAGFLAFVSAFFLPAINFADTPSSSALSGWFCARYALWQVYANHSMESFSKSLVILSGLINPIIAIYLTLSLTKRFPYVRLFLASCLPICLASTWFFLFGKAHMVTLIGHYLWVAGAILITAREFDQASF